MAALAAQAASPQMGRTMGDWNRGAAMMQPGIAGTVSAVDVGGVATTFTVNGRSFGRGIASSTTAYTVDASNATVTKNNASSSVSAIAAGDQVFVRGTVSGTNVAATMVRDGVMPGGGSGRGRGMGGFNFASSSPRRSNSSPIQGNGQPVVAGKVATISGTTLTVTNQSNLTYTVDASNAQVMQGKTTSTLSAVAVGDTVVVQGTVNGTAITASSLIDQKPAPAAGSTSANTPAGAPGLLGRIGGFFMHLFGF